MKKIASISLISFFLASCSSSTDTSPSAAAPAEKSIPIRVAAAHKEDIPLFLSSVGRISASQTAEIRPMITAAVRKIHFKTGQIVQKGDLLFELDHSNYQIRVDETRASLAKNITQLRYSQKQLQRYQSLFDKGLLTDVELDEGKKAVALHEAQVLMDQARVKAAQLELDYCTIRSPISGRIGKTETGKGNLAEARSLLCTVRQSSQLSVKFSLPERYLSQIVQQNLNELKVEVTIPGLDNRSYIGTLDYGNNHVDPETGSIALKAKINNEDNLLWPGQFAKVKVQIGLYENAITVPATSLQMNDQGHYVWVIDEDSRVAIRAVNLQDKINEQVIISNGIEEGERVVNGGLSLYPSALVEVVGDAEV
ncbi:MAG: hypothetical protein CMO81_12470 [Waddliaceae bacterium]|nr:hypothetical protein [Waddliaceae bacterium]